MSTLRSDNIVGRDQQSSPSFPKGVVIAGVATATTFKGGVEGNVTGNVTGNASGSSGSCTGNAATATALQNARTIGGVSFDGTANINLPGVNATGNQDTSGTAATATVAQGLTGTPSITVNDATVKGNLTVDGTQTILNTETLDVADKTVGIGSTSNASDTTADDAGIVIYGSTDGSNDKTLTWTKDTGNFKFNQPLTVKGVTETVAAASTHEAAGVGAFVLELDLASATTFKYTLPALGNIGIVSFKNMPADGSNANGLTATVIFTQASSTPAGFGNTTAATGIGTNCYITPWTTGTPAGISTRGKVGSASTVTLSLTKDDVDFVSFFVDYNGSTNTVSSNYKVYVTKNGNFRQGTVGI